MKSNGVTITLAKFNKTESWTDLKPKKSLIGDKTSKGGSGDGLGDIMGMMKEMYQNGDDEMKKTIAESWQKSQDG